jgi:hypothetical protein
MLTTNSLMQFISLNLGVPYRPVEYDTTQILNYILQYSIPTFSHYLPYMKHVSIGSRNFMTDTQGNAYFLIVDDQNLDILSVRKVIPSLSTNLLAGEPWVIFTGQNDALDLQMQVNWVSATRTYSPINISFEFIAPNILYIYPTYIATASYWAIEYAVNHAPDFSTIPPLYQQTFMQLACGDVLLLIANLRAQYGNELPTPFGNIPLNADALKDRGEALRNEALESLKGIPPVQAIYVG